MRNLLKENRGLLVFLACFGLFRTAVADWNPIPSGSMRPTLLEGDVVLVNRLAYDLKLPLTDRIVAHIGDPARGDVVTFSSPADGTRLIKRIVGLPGDIIEMRGKALIVNGEPVAYAALARVEEPLGNGQLAAASQWHEALPGRTHVVQLLDDASAHSRFGPIAVPAGHYLMLGDNRDLSGDSRVFGFVPRERLIGRAHRILVSADILGDWAPRLARWGRALI